MDGKAKNLKWFSGDGVKVEIPYFQRPYVWDEVDWKNLLDGINDEPSGKMPFIGSIILKKEGNDENNPKYLVIDGQQRLMTLSILIKALLDSYPTINSEYKVNLLGMIYETRDEDPNNPIHISRIKPSNSDSEDFKLVMSDEVDEEKLEASMGQVAKAYSCFRDEFKHYDESRKSSISAKLRTNFNFFIEITIDSNDDEQKIFDSVNSLGKKLTNADIIKNYLYQQLKNKSPQDEASQNKVLQQYYNDWENVFYSTTQKEFWNGGVTIGRTELTYLETFFKDFGILKDIYNPLEKDSFKGIVNSYKKKIDELDSSGLSKLSNEISTYANAYFKMFTQYKDCNNFVISDYFNTTMLILDKTQTSTFNPFMLKLYKDNPGDANEQYFALQKFLLRRLVYKMSTKNYNKICEQLLNENNPIEKLNNYVDFSDVDFKEYPSGLLNVNNSQGTLLLFVIEMIRRAGKEELMDTDLNYTDKLSLEHIMPKKWETHWLSVPCYKKINMLGSVSYEKVIDVNEISTHRKTKINSIGNMTILTNKLNTAISNDTFNLKINGDAKRKGIRKYVSLSVAKDIVDTFESQGSWTEKDIYIREEALFSDLNKYYTFK